MARDGKSPCSSPHPVPGTTSLMELSFLEAPPLTPDTFSWPSEDVAALRGLHLSLSRRAELMDTRMLGLISAERRAGHHAHTHAGSLLLNPCPFLPKRSRIRGRSRGVTYGHAKLGADEGR